MSKYDNAKAAWDQLKLPAQTQLLAQALLTRRERGVKILEAYAKFLLSDPSPQATNAFLIATSGIACDARQEAVMSALLPETGGSARQ